MKSPNKQNTLPAEPEGHTMLIPAMHRIARRLTLALVTLVCAATVSMAQSPRAAQFDYYVMALSWSPSWCAIEGDGRRADQCRTGSNTGWVLHGLWPQHNRGWPSYCQTAQPAPTRAMTGAMSDIMGSTGLAWHQWRKHGTCSGLSARSYLDLSRKAYDQIVKPAVFQQLDRPVRLPARLIEQAFLRENPAFRADMLTVVCRQRRIYELRVCLAKDLTPRRCGDDVIRDCDLPDAMLDPPR